MLCEYLISNCTSF